MPNTLPGEWTKSCIDVIGISVHVSVKNKLLLFELFYFLKTGLK